MLEKKSFLVFSGGNDRAIMGFLRALRLCDSRACVIARTTDDRILLSDYRRDVEWVRPTHELSLDVFAESVRRARTRAGAGTFVVLPSTEYFNNFLLQNRREIEEMGCEIPLVEASLYMKLTQKGFSADFFSAAGLSVPREVGAHSVAEQPIVAKPLLNVSKAGQSLYPHLLRDGEQLEIFLKTNDQKDYFFQEYVRGESIYLLFHISQKEGGSFTWSQRNLLQQPGGKSMLLAEPASFHQCSTAKNIVLALRSAGFHGLGMVEIIRTDDQEVFIEMNPRIWGPVQFCLDQRQPLLQAFIGDALHGDPLLFIGRQARLRRSRYFWFGGVLETLAARQPTAGTNSDHSILPTVAQNIFRDVYLRLDSWRCFAHDATHFLTGRKSGERTQG